MVVVVVVGAVVAGAVVAGAVVAGGVGPGPGGGGAGGTSAPPPLAASAMPTPVPTTSKPITTLGSRSQPATPRSSSCPAVKPSPVRARCGDTSPAKAKVDAPTKEAAMATAAIFLEIVISVYSP